MHEIDTIFAQSGISSKHEDGDSQITVRKSNITVISPEMLIVVLEPRGILNTNQAMKSASGSYGVQEQSRAKINSAHDNLR
jgi:hypothetical protein